MASDKPIIDDAAARQWSRGIARGDRTALGAFFEAHFDPACALALRLTGRDESFALDVVQDAMIRVAASMPALDTVAAMHAWFGRVVRSAAIDRLRAEARETRHEAAAIGGARDPIPTDASGPLDARERADWVHAQLAAAADMDHELVHARFVRGVTLESAAASANCTPPAAHGRLRRLIDRLRKTAKESPP